MEITPSIELTADGSQTLRHPLSGEAYHSLNGALAESEHVFIRNGFDAWWRSEAGGDDTRSDFGTDSATCSEPGGDSGTGGVTCSYKVCGGTGMDGDVEPKNSFGAGGDEVNGDSGTNNGINRCPETASGTNRCPGTDGNSVTGGRTHIRILEIGFGSGLNALLTLRACRRGLDGLDGLGGGRHGRDERSVDRSGDRSVERDVERNGERDGEWDCNAVQDDSGAQDDGIAGDTRDARDTRDTRIECDDDAGLDNKVARDDVSGCDGRTGGNDRTVHNDCAAQNGNAARTAHGRRTVYYTAVELYPVSSAVASAMELAGDECFRKLHAAPWGTPQEITEGFTLHKIEADLADLIFETTFDLVYFDAFAPDVQPELWTPAVFGRIYDAMEPGGMLVTYSAKGDVKRALRGVGFVVERLPGAPGKRHMLRALKPSGG